MVYAGVMELADVVDSKSTASDGVPVRVRPPAPPRRRGLRLVRGGLFLSKKTTSLTLRRDSSSAKGHAPFAYSLASALVYGSLSLTTFRGDYEALQLNEYAN